jgi:hypothetical protein
MGATFSLVMFAIMKLNAPDSQRSFSYLYLANVLGAVLGATIPPLLIEALGFRGTLRVGAVLNLLLASSAVALTLSTSHDRITLARVLFSSRSGLGSFGRPCEGIRAAI